MPKIMYQTMCIFVLNCTVTVSAFWTYFNMCLLSFFRFSLVLALTKSSSDLGRRMSSVSKVNLRLLSLWLSLSSGNAKRVPATYKKEEKEEEKNLKLKFEGASKLQLNAKRLIKMNSLVSVLSQFVLMPFTFVLYNQYIYLIKSHVTHTRIYTSKSKQKQNKNTHSIESTYASVLSMVLSEYLVDIYNSRRTSGPLVGLFRSFGTRPSGTIWVMKPSVSFAGNSVSSSKGAVGIEIRFLSCAVP